MEKRSGAANRKAILAILALVAAVLVAVVAFTVGGGSSPGVPRDNAERYRIGAILPLSGNLAFMGQMEGDGMRLAVEDINAAGGVDGTLLDLLLDDSQGKADIGVTAAQKMMAVDGVTTVISSFSSVTLGIKPFVESNGGILIGACMHPDFYKESPNVFRFYIGVEDESRGFVDYLSAQKSSGTSPRIGCLYVEAPEVPPIFWTVAK